MPDEDEDSFPVLSERSNIVVMADEAHRTQYGFKATLKERRTGLGPNRPVTLDGKALTATKSIVIGDGVSSAMPAHFEPPQYGARYQAGYAQHLRDALPNATFVGFTGTPVASSDHDTRAVFGDYIHVYDMQQAKEDGATVARGDAGGGAPH